ncbi:MAG: glycosyltransferase family 2 protein [Chitinophagaceae bacterium]|nr:glycosyltransferase family 2 protein [Chitinophagaceae bacterium]
MAKIGLVTVLFKSDEVLEGFFNSISKQTFKDYILYLVDNSVNDRSNQVIADCMQKYPVTQCEHIKNPGNEGVARGNNIGIQQALNDGCTHILILNNDIEIEQETAFASQLSICEERGEKIVVPKIYYPDRTIWMAGGAMNKWRALGIHYGYNKPDSAEYNSAKYITYAPTCYMLVERSVFDKVGMMDEKYFAYYDDTDFVYRSLNKGFKMYYDPSVTIIHKVSHSSGGDSSFYIFYSNRNKLYFIRKNFSGFLKWFAIGYTFFTRIFYWLRFNKEQRKKLIQALKDGMTYPV